MTDTQYTVSDISASFVVFDTTMQGICCRDLDVVVTRKGAYGGDTPRPLLDFAGRYHPQQKETAVNGTEFPPCFERQTIIL